MFVADSSVYCGNLLSNVNYSNGTFSLSNKVARAKIEWVTVESRWLSQDTVKSARDKFDGATKNLRSWEEKVRELCTIKECDKSEYTWSVVELIYFLFHL